MTATTNMTNLGRKSARDLCTDDIVWQHDRNDGSRFLVRIMAKDRQIDSLSFYLARRLDDGERCTASFDNSARPTVYLG